MDLMRWGRGLYEHAVGGWLNPLGLDAHTDARKVLKKDEWNRITIQAVGDTIKFEFG